MGRATSCFVPRLEPQDHFVHLIWSYFLLILAALHSKHSMGKKSYKASIINDVITTPLLFALPWRRSQKKGQICPVRLSQIKLCDVIPEISPTQDSTRSKKYNRTRTLNLFISNLPNTVGKIFSP